MLDKKAFKNTVYLIIELAGDEGIGATRLNKCLVFCDAMHQALHREGLTGASYIKHKHGPVLNKKAHDYLISLIDDKYIEVYPEPLPSGETEYNHYLSPGIKASRELFSTKDIELISWAVSIVKNMSARELSDITHDRSYNKTAMFHEINLEDIYTWEIDGKPSNSLSTKSSEINFNELDNLIQTQQAAVN